MYSSVPFFFTAGGAHWESGLRHDQAAFDDGGGDTVKRAETAVPLGGSIVDGHDVAFWELFETDEVGHVT